MTPDKARALLDGTTPGDEWYYQVKWGSVQYIEPVTVTPGGEVDVTEEDAALIVAAPTLATMIAGMREEWGVSYRWANDDTARIEWGNDTREEAVKWARKLENYPGSRAYVFGIVRRYVTTPEEIE